MRGLLIFLLEASVAVDAAPQRIILDTDMGFDVDDVGAVCLANSLQMAGLAKVLAIVHNTGCTLGIGGVSAMNHFYGNDDIILGAWKGRYGKNCDKYYEGTFGQNQYLATVIRKTGGPIKNASMVMTGTDAYRKALAMAPDGSVNVASIGMPTNLRDLLNTTADKYSPLSGVDLVAKKVAKVVFMDGGYNFGCAAGNIGPAYDCEGGAMNTLKAMPPNVRMVFSSKGSSPPIYTGKGMQKSHPASSPCREAYKHWCCNPKGEDGTHGRLSWDPITVMIAALDVGSVYEKETDYGTQVTADEAGRENFFGNGTTNAKTDFNISATDAALMISASIDHYLNMVPSHVTTNVTANVTDAEFSTSFDRRFDAVKLGRAIVEAKSIFDPVL